jgi:formylglycine-generating enzyme
MDMEEDYEPILPKRSDPPPLKRLWVSPPEPEPAASPTPSTKKKQVAAEVKDEKPKKKKTNASEEVIDDGTGSIKLEATPVLDTYETRQRVRLIGGLILGSIVVLGVIIAVGAFKRSGTEEARDTEPTENRANIEARASAEREARLLLDMAKQFDQQGKTKTTLEQLNKVTTNYPGTAASREAMHALDRHKQDLPLFGVDAPIQQSGPKKPPPDNGTAPGPVISKNAVASNANPAGEASPPDRSKAAPPPVVPRPVVTQKIPSFYRANFDFPIDPSGWPTRLVCELDGSQMVLVTGTRFVMGRADGPDEEGPPHEVFVSTYYIDLHEVTIGQYLRFLKETGRGLDIARLTGNGKHPSEDLPMVNVTQNSAKAYCEWAKRKLPTEAQWELAARGPEGRISYWNEILPRKDPEKGDRQMEPVMSLKTDVSPYGAFDMGANAWEWTSEYYDSKYYKQFRNVVNDPTGPKEAPAKTGVKKATIKGGSSTGILTWRTGRGPETKQPYIGFRGVLLADPPITPVVAPPPATGPAATGGVQPF